MPIEHLLDNWRAWGLSKRPVLVRMFDQGLSHDTALLKTDGELGEQELVLKMFGRDSGWSVAVQKRASEFGVAPKVLFHSDHGHYCLMEYLHPAKSIQVPIEELVASLRLVHSAKTWPESTKFSLMHHCDNYLQGLDPNYQRLHSALLPALKKFIGDATTQVFCHNDLVAENYLLNNGKIFLLDWEYAQTNNPWFDLASLVFYQDLNIEQQQILLQGYWQNELPENADELLMAALCAVNWLDILWHAQRDPNPGLAKHHTQLKKLLRSSKRFLARELTWDS